MNNKDKDLYELEKRIKILENELNCQNLESRIKILEKELLHIKKSIQYQFKKKKIEETLNWSSKLWMQKK